MKCIIVEDMKFPGNKSLKLPAIKVIYTMNGKNILQLEKDIIVFTKDVKSAGKKKELRVHIGRYISKNEVRLFACGR